LPSSGTCGIIPKLLRFLWKFPFLWYLHAWSVPKSVVAHLSLGSLPSSSTNLVACNRWDSLLVRVRSLSPSMERRFVDVVIGTTITPQLVVKTCTLSQ
jgi:hypothetical protein